MKSSIKLNGWLGCIDHQLLAEDLFLIIELDRICKSRVDCWLEDLSHAFNDVFAVLGSIDNPADVFLKGLGCPATFVEATFTVNEENLLNYTQNIQQ